MNGDTLYNLGFEPRRSDKTFKFLQFFNAPHSPYGFVVYGGNNTRHTLYLFYIIKGYAVVFAVPAESHLHKIFLFYLFRRSSAPERSRRSKQQICYNDKTKRKKNQRFSPFADYIVFTLSATPPKSRIIKNFYNRVYYDKCLSYLQGIIGS